MFNTFLHGTPLGGYGLIGAGVLFVIMIVFRTIISQGVRRFMGGGFSGRRQGRGMNRQARPPRQESSNYFPHQEPNIDTSGYDEREERRARKRLARQQQENYPHTSSKPGTEE